MGITPSREFAPMSARTGVDRILHPADGKESEDDWEDKTGGHRLGQRKHQVCRIDRGKEPEQRSFHHTAEDLRRLLEFVTERVGN